MTEEATNPPTITNPADFVLPASIISKLDVSKLVQEAEQVDMHLTTAEVRSKAGAEQTPQPVVSEQLTEFLQQNNLSLNDSHARSEMIKLMRAMKDSVPVIHMTFAVKTDPDSLSQIADWLRKSVHPQAVISVGLQPALVAGVYLRTPNRVHDLSLRKMLEENRGMLAQQLEALRAGQ